MEKRARAPSPDLGVFAVTTKSPDALTECTNCQKRRVRTGQVRLHYLTDFQASPRLANGGEHFLGLLLPCTHIW